MSLEWVNCEIEQHFDEFPHIWSGFHWNMNWKALFGLAISCVLLLAPARILASSEAAAGGHNNGTERYKLVVFDFERVELPFVICLWILIVALAKIGAYLIKRLYRFHWLAHYSEMKLVQHSKYSWIYAYIDRPALRYSYILAIFLFLHWNNIFCEPLQLFELLIQLKIIGFGMCLTQFNFKLFSYKIDM